MEIPLPPTQMKSLVSGFMYHHYGLRVICHVLLRHNSILAFRVLGKKSPGDLWMASRKTGLRAGGYEQTGVQHANGNGKLK